MGAGTVEFIMDAETGEYFFMEMYVPLVLVLEVELDEVARKSLMAGTHDYRLNIQ